MSDTYGWAESRAAGEEDGYDGGLFDGGYPSREAALAVARRAYPERTVVTCRLVPVDLTQAVLNWLHLDEALQNAAEDEAVSIDVSSTECAAIEHALFAPLQAALRQHVVAAHAEDVQAHPPLDAGPR